MSALFEDFTRAASQSKTAAPKTARQFTRIAVLGGGVDARQLAALALPKGRRSHFFLPMVLNLRWSAAARVLVYAGQDRLAVITLIVRAHLSKPLPKSTVQCVGLKLSFLRVQFTNNAPMQWCWQII